MQAEWVFAYGSLIWDRPFTAAEAIAGRVWGWRRSMCLLSTHYRGTEQQPGLVLGLEPGGSCQGLALRLDPGQQDAVWADLHAREMITNAYRPTLMRVRLADGRQVQAGAYVMRRDHPQYAGPLDDAARAALIRRGVGARGRSRDYLAQTVATLQQLGLRDQALVRLLRLTDQGAEPG